MAREPVDQSKENGTGIDSESDDKYRQLLNRRSYLKIAGSAAVASAAAGAASAADGYEVIEVAEGETFTKRVSSGETWENKLIDISASGAGYSIDAEGSGWTIRNIGVRGRWDYTPGSSPFTVDVPDSSGSAIIENVYLPGEDSVSMGDPTGIYVHPTTAGTITMRNLYVARFGDNGIYASAPGNPEAHPVPGSHGTIEIYDSYVTKCRTNVRVSTDSSVVENVVSTNPVGGKSCFRDYYGLGVTFRNCDAYAPSNACFKTGSSTWNGSRGVECGPGPTLENCRAEGSTILTGPCSFTGSPDLGPRTEPPEGVPLSPEQAANGDASADQTENGDTGSSDKDNTSDTGKLENTILVDGVSTSGSTQYEVSVSGAIEKATLEGASIDGEDTIESGQVTGSVAGWRDAFRFSGELENLTVDGSARVYVNGEQVDPSKYGNDLSHVLTVVGNGTESSYEATVDGTIETLDAPDNVKLTSGSSVSGTVKRDVHRFQFSGELVDFVFIEGGTQVYVDDQRIDPSNYDNDRALPSNAIVFDGSGTDDPSTYSFTVDGDVVKSSYRDASIDEEDVIEGKTVRGAVANWLDAYWFEGNITDFRLEGNASVDIEYDVHNQ